MKVGIIKPIAATLVAGLLMQLSACGTILYPERIGQKGGQIDPGVAVLNAVGLLVFLVPGVIAFAVDFTNGTIYLPNSSADIESGATADYVALDIDPNKAAIERALLAHTGQVIELDQGHVANGRSTVSLASLSSQLRML